MFKDKFGKELKIGDIVSYIEYDNEDVESVQIAKIKQFQMIDHNHYTVLVDSIFESYGEMELKETELIIAYPIPSQHRDIIVLPRNIISKEYLELLDESNVQYRLRYRNTDLFYAPVKVVKNKNGEMIKTNLSPKGRVYKKRSLAQSALTGLIYNGFFNERGTFKACDGRGRISMHIPEDYFEIEETK